MNENTKINLSAIKNEDSNNSNEDDSLTSEDLKALNETSIQEEDKTVTTSVEEEVVHKPRISLNSIRTHKSSEQKTEEAEEEQEQHHEDVKEELAEALKAEIWDIEEIEEKVVKAPKKKSKKEEIKEINEKIKKEALEETSKKFNVKDWNDNNEDWDIFSNYHSDFLGEEDEKIIKEEENEKEKNEKEEVKTEEKIETKAEENKKDEVKAEENKKETKKEVKKKKFKLKLSKKLIIPIILLLLTAWVYWYIETNPETTQKIITKSKNLKTNYIDKKRIAETIIIEEEFRFPVEFKEKLIWERTYRRTHDLIKE